MKIAILILLTIIPPTLACKVVYSITQYSNSTDVYKAECETENAHYPLSFNTSFLEEQLIHSVNVEQENPHYTENTGVKGNKALLVVRVMAPDASTSISSEKLSQSVFGATSARSQYSDCSFNKLNFHPATGPGVSNGVMEITIPQNVKGIASYVVQNAITENLGGKPLNADHVMYCLPPGTTGGWIAYAYTNHWLSVYNDKWCTYLSAQMHEIGHNFGLLHSGEDKTAYGDQSGYMGYSYGVENEPLMCFNGPKSWQLGWYMDKTHSMNATKREKYEGSISGIVDYATTTLPVIIRLQTEDSKDVFVMYNKKAEFNVGTKEGPDQVLVTTAVGNNVYGSSTLLSKMDVGQSFTLPNNYTINVISRNDEDGIKISIKPGNCSSDPNCRPPVCRLTTQDCWDIKSLLKAPKPNTGSKDKYKSSTVRRNFTY